MSASRVYAAAPAARTPAQRRLRCARAQAPPPQIPGVASGGPRSSSGGAAQPAAPAAATTAARPSRRRVLAALPPCGCAVCAGAAGAAGGKPRSGVMDAVFAQAMAEGMADYEQHIAPVKQELFTQLLSQLAARRGGGSGAPAEPAQLLELGVGTGPNLPFYAAFYNLAAAGSSGGGGAASGAAAAAASPSAAAAAGLPPLHIIGVDRNEYMRGYLDDSLPRSGWPRERLTWVQGDAEALPLGDASVDAVVCTLVLCSVPDVAQVLQEVARVLKPGGSLLFVEHTTAQQRQPLLWLAQRVLEPLQRLLADNCHLTRDPLPLIAAAPAFGGMQARRFRVEGASLIAPHVAGLAQRQPQAP